MKANTGFYLLLLVTLVACDTKEIKRDRFFLQGNQALSEKEYRQAITHYTNALKVDKDFALAYNNRGVTYAEDGSPFEAIQDYNQAIMIDPDYWEAIANRANAYELTGQYEKSLRDIRLLQTNFPDSMQFVFLGGIVLTHLDSLEAAADAFTQVWEIDGTNVEALVNLANVRYYQKDYELAIQLLDQAKEVDPLQPNIYNTLNQVFLEIASYEQALEAINEAIAIDPANPIFLNNRGYTYLQVDSLRAAIQDINASLVRDPQNMWAFRNKGIYFLKSGDLTQAERYLLQAAEDKPSVPEAYEYLAKVYDLMGRTADAAKAQSMSGMTHHH